MRIALMQRIAIQRRWVSVAGEGAAHDLEEIFDAAVFEVCEDHGVALLQVAEAGCGGHVLETFGCVVEEGAVG